MTVKCLTDEAKELIGQHFVIHEITINELVGVWNRSRRTIIRVLEEQGIDPGIKTRAPKKKKEPVPASGQPVITPTKLPWYRRIFGSMVGGVGTRA